MKKTFILPILFSLPFLSGCGQEDTTTSSENPKSDDSSVSETSSLPDVSGLDLLEQYFESYVDSTVTVDNMGVQTEYFLEKAYYCDYSKEVEEFYEVSDYGFIENSQAIFDFKLQDDSIVLNKAVSYAHFDYFAKNNLTTPADLYDYARYGEDGYFVWEELEEYEVPQSQGDSAEEIYKDNLGVFESTDDQAIIVSAVIGGLDLDVDEEGYYEKGSLDTVRVIIKSDHTLHFEVMAESFRAAIYEIKDVNNTKLDFIDNYFANPYEKEKRDPSFSAKETNFMNSNLGVALPFPNKYSFSFTTASAGLSAFIFFDSAIGDITEDYVAQCVEAGFEKTEDEEKKSEIMCDVLMIKNINEDGSSYHRIAISYSDPTEECSHGVFTVSLSNYPYSM